MVYYKPHITGQYSSLYNQNTDIFFMVLLLTPSFFNLVLIPKRMKFPELPCFMKNSGHILGVTYLLMEKILHQLIWFQYHHYLRRLSYMSGGDRHISEPSTVSWRLRASPVSSLQVRNLATGSYYISLQNFKLFTGLRDRLKSLILQNCFHSRCFFFLSIRIEGKMKELPSGQLT